MLKSNVSHRNFHGQKAKHPETKGIFYTYICDVSFTLCGTGL